MSKFLISSRTHWIEQDAFSSKELKDGDMIEALEDIEKRLLDYLNSKVPPKFNYNLDIKFFTHEGYKLLHHLTVNLKLFPTVHTGPVVKPGSTTTDLVLRGVTVVPPAPPPPMPFDSKLLHPLIGDFNLRAQSFGF